MEKAFDIQRQARDNVQVFKSYMTDLQNWEVEMKRKEAALNGDFEQDLPPVRSKVKKDKPVKVVKKQDKRIAASDYQAWDQFDVDRACEEIDMEDVGPTSLDSKKSEKEKQERLREEAQYEKERGNSFVKQEKWDEAISCYNRAIELVKNDAIYYANRGLCHLKKESLHQAESDCTEALNLDPTYVKALQRRATARERLGSLRAASRDLQKVIELEPQNNAARRQLAAITARMGTKGTKYKTSPQSTPTVESKPITVTSKTTIQPKIIELTDEPSNQQLVQDQNWRDGVGENITVIKPVKKPPHLRSKRSLKSINIQEVLLGKTAPEKPPTRLKIIEIDSNSQGDTNNNDSNKMEETINNLQGKGDFNVTFSPESDKLISDTIVSEKDVCSRNLTPPANSVQFMADWKYLKGYNDVRSEYLCMIDPNKIPSIFENALESDVLSEVISSLYDNIDKFKDKKISNYLRGLSRVKRFSTLAMFLTSKEKDMLTKLLNHCKTVEKCSDEEISDLKNKYEL